jgi:protein HIRA/HIR1
MARLLEVDGRNVDLIKFEVASNGAPIVITSEPAAYAFDPSYNDWRELFTADITLSSAPALSGDRMIATTEQQIRALSPSTQHDERDHGPAETLLLNHLYSRVRAAQLLSSRKELESFAEDYAKALDERRLKDRAIELCHELQDANETGALEAVVERFASGANMRDLARVFRARV